MTEAPERIYGWLDSQLSIARHFGGCNYNGSRYVIDYKDARMPLVRWDVVQREAKAAKKKTPPVAAIGDMFEGESQCQ